MKRKIHVSKSFCAWMFLIVAAVMLSLVSVTGVAQAGKEVKTTAASAKTAATKPAPGTKININTADQATLKQLPDIGPSKAQAIIKGRPYGKIEDIMKVSGIKKKTFEAIKDYIVVQ